MSEIQMEIAAQGEVVCTVLMHLKNGKISDAMACFAEKFEFKDRGIGLKFKNRDRLAEFFQKTRELYPDSSPQPPEAFLIPLRCGASLLQKARPSRDKATMLSRQRRPWYLSLFRQLACRVQRSQNFHYSFTRSKRARRFFTLIPNCFRNSSKTSDWNCRTVFPPHR
jgi:hypothetical protein